MTRVLTERLSPKQSNMIAEGGGVDENGKPKNYYLKGIFIQGGIRNHNGRIYPVNEIRSAVDQINQRLASGESILGEVDHPEELNINLDRVSHMITEMYMNGPNGCGTMKIIETVPMGQLIKGFLDAGVQLGVSSRGSGNVNGSGEVDSFEIITVDIVSNPSGPSCLPSAIREARMRSDINYLATEAVNDKRAQHYLQKELINLIKGL